MVGNSRIRYELKTVRKSRKSNYYNKIQLQVKLLPPELDDLNRNFNAPDIVQSTIKFNEDFFDKQV